MKRLTLRESIKQISIDLKQYLDGTFLLPFASAGTANLNILSAIIKIDETFFFNPLKKRIISCIGKLEKYGREKRKE
ncbi:MAG: hypothetical protein ACTS78_00265 [Arsenophonus sp. NC-WZS1-MAG3]